MSAPDDGGPAYPSGKSEKTGYENTLPYYEGMTLRDWFAGQALQGLLASGHFTDPGNGVDGAFMTTHEDPYDDDTCEEIHKGRRRFDFPEAAWRCANKMISTRNNLP